VIAQKRLLHSYRSAFVTGWMYIFGSIALLVSVLPLATSPHYWHLDNRQIGIALAFGILAASAVNYSLIAWTNKRLSPVILTASYPLESVLAPGFAYAVLGQKLSLADAMGGAVMIGGLALFTIAKFRESVDAPPTVADIIAEKVEAAALSASGLGGPLRITAPSDADAGVTTSLLASPGTVAGMSLSNSGSMGGATAHARRRTTASRIFLDPATATDADATALVLPIGTSHVRAASMPALHALGSTPIMTAGIGPGTMGGGGGGYHSTLSSPIHPLLHRAVPGSGYQQLDSLGEGDSSGDDAVAVAVDVDAGSSALDAHTAATNKPPQQRRRGKRRRLPSAPGFGPDGESGAGDSMPRPANPGSSLSSADFAALHRARQSAATSAALASAAAAAAAAIDEAAEASGSGGSEGE